MSKTKYGAIILSVAALTTVTAYAQDFQHAMALHDTPKYAADFTHVDYVNPQAPKGGTIKRAVVGTFDSLNPYILKGMPAGVAGFTHVTLMEKSLDEPLTSYGIVAESVRVAQDRSWVTFTLRKQAVWHDGKPITADDVVWSFNTLLAKGLPFFRSYYSQVKSVKADNTHQVTFTFKTKNNRELPLIVGDLPILPKHYWTSGEHDFTKTTLIPPLGNGPYKITNTEVGRRIVLERVKDWWGKDLPMNKGRYNFDRIIVDYYRDPGVAFQAFIGGNVDIRFENIAKNWAQAYDVPAVRQGQIKKEEIENQLPAGMQAFVYNTRRPVFQNIKVREALAYAFDFEWSNRQLAFGSYRRNNSFFENSDLAAKGLITSEEKALLEEHKDRIPSRVFTDFYEPPKTDGSGNIRANLRKGMNLLREAGYSFDKGVMKDASGKQLTFEIITDSAMFDRWILPFIANLRRMGVKAVLRELDHVQFQNRVNNFDFDMTITVFSQSLTPGNEQYAYFGSEQAEQPGSMNLAGIKDPVVDKLIDEIVKADTREKLVTATRALDRVLLWNFYVIPQWYVNTYRIAYWDHFGRPDKMPPYGLPIVETWWSTKP